MDIIQKFGGLVGAASDKDPVGARRLLLAGYRLQEKRLAFFPDKKLPPSGRYVADVVMENMIQALARPENAAMVSIFVPGELIAAAGLTPYSVEAMSCFLAGTHCEQKFLSKTGDEGFPETMCSYHRVFLGAALTGLVPDPKCILYTNLACDANMMTFPYLKQKKQLPAFFIDVPYEKDAEAVDYVAGQLREAVAFLEDVAGRSIPEAAVREAVAKSDQAAAFYQRQVDLRRDHAPATTLTNELYALFMCHLLAGREEAVKYTRLLLEDVQAAPVTGGIRLLWMHMMPYLQAPVKEVFNYSDQVSIAACDFICDGFREVREQDPFRTMAERMVYSIYNGSAKGRTKNAVALAKRVGADGAILFAHWGCKSTVGASGLIREALESAGIPTLVLDGDGCNPANVSDGQTATRLQAFLEMLK